MSTEPLIYQRGDTRSSLNKSKIWSPLMFQVSDDISDRTRTRSTSHFNKEKASQVQEDIDNKDLLEIEEEVPLNTCVMQSFTLFKTPSTFYLAGSNTTRTQYEVLEIERKSPDELQVTPNQDGGLMTRTECQTFLDETHNENIDSGGLTVETKADGLIGFVKFLDEYYIILITGKEKVGSIAGKYIYRITETKMIPISDSNQQNGKKEKMNPRDNTYEMRYKNLFQGVDLGQDFYFSYTYDVTNSLQTNMKRTLENSVAMDVRFNEMFLWNFYLSQELLLVYPGATRWIVPVVHGFFEQTTLLLSNRRYLLTLIARRSRHRAGARYIKRGVDEAGDVANQVETEQILFEQLPFSCGNGRFTSVVMLRGSVPLHWSQSNPLSVRPEMLVHQTNDPDYRATEKHFEKLFDTYGSPVMIMNLMRQQESHARETLLGAEFDEVVGQLSGVFLQKGLKLSYFSYDLLTHRKNGMDVIFDLGKAALTLLDETGIFKYIPSAQSDEKLEYQNGVVRVNCVDCLDRTNIAEFCLGVRALERQLFMLGATRKIESLDTIRGLTSILQEMYQRHGDRIAQQYGGSAAMHRGVIDSATTGKGGKKREFAKNALTSIKRYISNNVTDVTKQYAINVFLGNYVPKTGRENIWDMDAAVNHEDVELKYPRIRHGFKIPLQILHDTGGNRENGPLTSPFDEYYNPGNLTSFDEELEFEFGDPVVVHDSLFQPAHVHDVPPNEDIRNFSSYSAHLEDMITPNPSPKPSPPSSPTVRNRNEKERPQKPEREDKISSISKSADRNVPPSSPKMKRQSTLNGNSKLPMKSLNSVGTGARGTLEKKSEKKVEKKPKPPPGAPPPSVIAAYRKESMGANRKNVEDREPKIIVPGQIMTSQSSARVEQPRRRTMTASSRHESEVESDFVRYLDMKRLMNDAPVTSVSSAELHQEEMEEKRDHLGNTAPENDHHQCDNTRLLQSLLVEVQKLKESQDLINTKLSSFEKVLRRSVYDK